MSEWKPGDVAATDYNGVQSRALVVKGGSPCPPGHDRGLHWHGVSGGWNPIDDDAVTFRPLAVIDPEDREQVERLVDILHEAPWFDGQINKPTHTSVLQAALREFAKPRPPKPEEPTGLGAVVRDRIGHTWTRTHRPSSVIEGGRKPWTAEIDTGFDSDYADIDVVKVLDEGWPE